MKKKVYLAISIILILASASLAVYAAIYQLKKLRAERNYTALRDEAREDEDERLVRKEQWNGIEIPNKGLNWAEIKMLNKDIYGYISGAYINADRIDFKTNGLTVRNNSGQTTLQLDTNGNLTVRGTINGGSTIGGFSVNSNSLYMSEDSDGRYTDLEHGSLSIRTARSGTEYGLSVTGRIKVYAYDGYQMMRECLDFQGINSDLEAIWQFSLLPTSKPSNSGYLWNDSGTLKIS